MEELKLEDLQEFGVGTKDSEIFDAFTAQPGGKENTGGDDDNKDIKDPREEEAARQAAAAKNNTNPDSENPNKDSESVANGDKDNQGQADKATDKDGGSNSSSPKLNDSEKLYSKLAAQFVSKGVLSDLDPNEIKSLDDINDALAKEAEKRLTDEQAAIKEAMRTGAPVDEVATIIDTVNKLKGISEEKLREEGNDDLRKGLIAQDFVNRGYSSERALDLAQRSIDSGTGFEDAKFALTGIINHEETRKQGILQAAKDKEVKSLEDIKEKVTGKDELIPGINLTSVQRDEIFKQMTTDVGGRESAMVKAQKADPIGTRIKLETIFYLTKGLSDFSIFKEAGKTEASKEIETLLRGDSFTEDGKIETQTQDNNANFTLADLKDLKFD